MTDTETTPQETGGTVWDAPNQQAVRADQSPPWQEGTGGEPGSNEPGTAVVEDDLEAMTKANLLAQAQEMGVSPANNDMTKAELIAGIRAAGG